MAAECRLRPFVIVLILFINLALLPCARATNSSGRSLYGGFAIPFPVSGCPETATKGCAAGCCPAGMFCSGKGSFQVCCPNSKSDHLQFLVVDDQWCEKDMAFILLETQESG